MQSFWIYTFTSKWRTSIIRYKTNFVLIQSTENDTCLSADVRILKQSLVFKWYILTYHSLKQVGFQCTKSRNIHKKSTLCFDHDFLITTFPQNVSCQNSSTNLRKIKIKSLKRRVFFKFKLDKYQPCAAPTGADTRLLRRLSFSLY